MRESESSSLQNISSEIADTFRCSNGKNSRHVERKVYKMRELRTDGVVKLILVPTEDMTADLLTKPLGDAVFKKHRDEIMNLAVAPG